MRYLTFPTPSFKEPISIYIIKVKISGFVGGYLIFWDYLVNMIMNHRSAILEPGSEHLLKNATYVAWHNK